MKCPHCRVAFHDHPEQQIIGMDKDGGWIMVFRTCPECKRFVMRLLSGPPQVQYGRVMALKAVTSDTQVYPKGASRTPCPTEVSKDLAKDYTEACLVLSDSPKASAALSRRCLQNLLRSVAKVKPGDLWWEIQQVIDSGKLPSYLAENIDAVRTIGAFATHPVKSKSSGEILPVEPGEAEWNLDVLEGLFDFYFVQPSVVSVKREALNKKLAEAGKPPMKTGKGAGGQMTDKRTDLTQT